MSTPFQGVRLPLFLLAAMSLTAAGCIKVVVRDEAEYPFYEQPPVIIYEETTTHYAPYYVPPVVVRPHHGHPHRGDGRRGGKQRLQWGPGGRR